MHLKCAERLLIRLNMNGGSSRDYANSFVLKSLLTYFVRKSVIKSPNRVTEIYEITLFSLGFMQFLKFLFKYSKYKLGITITPYSYRYWNLIQSCFRNIGPSAIVTRSIRETGCL